MQLTHHSHRHGRACMLVCSPPRRPTAALLPCAGASRPTARIWFPSPEPVPAALPRFGEGRAGPGGWEMRMRSRAVAGGCMQAVSSRALFVQYNPWRASPRPIVFRCVQVSFLFDRTDEKSCSNTVPSVASLHCMRTCARGFVILILLQSSCRVSNVDGARVYCYHCYHRAARRPVPAGELFSLLKNC
jgi:hypothetical protein